MPPRKRAEAATPELAHSGICNSPRVEAFKALDPGGAEVTVTRCQECGEQEVK